MIFLTSNDEFKIHNTCILFFYSTDINYGIMKKYMYSFMNLSIPIICIDSNMFTGFIKRFNIDTLPTVLIFKDFKEIKRITGIVSMKNFQQLDFV
jgi:hypothetical protein